MIPAYPEFSEIKLSYKQFLDGRLKNLNDGISEFTFANLYLFRNIHQYKISALAEDKFVICGKDQGETFFMLPFGLPEHGSFKQLFRQFSTMKNATKKQSRLLESKGFNIAEDRDNFDYLYLRSEMAELSGRDFHKKRNLIKQFTDNNEYSAQPLLDEFRNDAFEILEKWHDKMQTDADYYPAKEALERMDFLQLCGCLYYVNNKPIGYSLGEELAKGTTFAIHFEKALKHDQYKGLYQFINQSFAAILPEKYEYINLEQDLGISGMRKAKKSYHPVSMVRKYKITAP